MHHLLSVLKIWWTFSGASSAPNMCPCFYYNAVLWFLLCSGMFSPTIFSLLFGHLSCVDCEPQTILVPLQPSNQSTNTSIKPGFQCRVCTQSVVSWCAHNLNQWWIGVHTVCGELVSIQSESMMSWCAHSLWWVGVHTVCGELVCTQSVVSWCAHSQWWGGVHIVYGELVCTQSVVSWCAHSLWWVGLHTDWVYGELVCTQSVLSWSTHRPSLWWVGVHASVVRWCAHSLWWVGVHTVCGKAVCAQSESVVS